MLSNNEQNERKSRIAALAGTVLFHALILLALLVLGFHTYHPLPSENGVQVNLDYAYLFKGNPESKILQQIDSNSSTTNSLDDNSFPDLTEEIPVTQKKKTITPAPHKGKISIIETPEEYTIVHRKPDINQIAKNSNGEGNVTATSKKSDQPKPSGTTTATDNAGNGSISYDLGGRGARILPKPTFNSPEDGKIVVFVKVNIEGKVISASAGAKGTTITQPGLRKQAENAAINTFFVRDTKAPEEHRGTITYVVVKQK